MLKIKSFAVLGGDLRQKYLAQYLMENGYQVNTFGEQLDGAVRYSTVKDCIRSSDAVVLPLPITKDNKFIYGNEEIESIPLSNILNDSLRRRVVFGGMANETVLGFVENNHVDFYDYFLMDDMTVKNAFATAEGAMAIAIQNTKTTIYESKVLVAGYGRIARALTKLLVAFGADVTVALRSSAQAEWAKLEGAKTISFEELSGHENFDLVFNTVPHIVFTKSELSGMDGNTLLIDLASFPGGVDLHQAKSQGINVITASALPSRFSPKSAGKFIAQSIISIIKEEV